jgi:hypothetical protein
MFESDRFQDNNERPQGNGFGNWIKFQQDIVTWMCILVIFGSMFFYFAVAYSEVAGKLPNWVKKVLCLKAKIDIHANIDIDGDGEIVFQENPHMQAVREQEIADATSAQFRDQLAAQQELITREKQKAARAIAGAQSGGGGGRRRKKKGRQKKKAFAPTSLRANAAEKELDLEVEMASIQIKIDSNDHDIDMSDPNNPKVIKRKKGGGGGGSLKKTNSFRKHSTDEGDDYYESVNDGSTHWQLPSGADVVDEENSNK